MIMLMLSRVFENSNFVVVDKPAGWLSVPGRMGEKDPRPVVGLVLQNEMGRQVYPCHRLDFEASGLLMFALSPQAHKVAQKWFENHQVLKTYQALTEWSDLQDSVLPTGSKPDSASSIFPLTWTGKIVRGKKRSFFADHGQSSTTVVLSVTELAFNPANLTASGELSQSVGDGHKVLDWRIQPKTGRPHQLRLDLSSRGFPILGDQLYGSKVEFAPNAIALRAIELDFGNCSEAQRFGLPNHLRASRI